MSRVYSCDKCGSTEKGVMGRTLQANVGDASEFNWAVAECDLCPNCANKLDSMVKAYIQLKPETPCK